MSAEIIREITVDFYGQKYISINAKQYDQASRFLSITCMNQGKVQHIDNKNSYSYVRYRKADDYIAINECTITNDGKILVELTRQMLSAPGICYAEIVILDKDDVVITGNPGEVVEPDEEVIKTTMTLYVNVKASVINNIGIESSNEFNALNDLLIRMTEDYNYILSSCQKSESKILEYMSMFKDFGGFKPMGTIAFEDLPKVENVPGNVYIIKNDFETNDTFLEPGEKHNAGTLVYCTSRVIEGTDPERYYWDCFASQMGILKSDIATLDELMGYIDGTLVDSDSNVATMKEFHDYLELPYEPELDVEEEEM